MAIYADRVLLGGRIYTVDEDFACVQAMAVKDGRIAYVGSDDGAMRFVGTDTEVVQLDGKTVTPGFIESHVHMNEYGHLLRRIKAYGKSKEQLISEIEEVASKLKPGEWVLGAARGNGFDYRQWGGRLPSLEELDEAAPDNPVVMFPATAGAGTWANTRALIALGIDPSDPQVQECRRLNEDGTKSGCFIKQVSGVLWRQTSKPKTWDDKVRAYTAAQQSLYSFGFTSLVDAANSGEVQADVEKLYADGTLSIRYYGCLSAAEDEATRKYFESCPIRGAYGGRYNVLTTKLGVDGTIDNYNAHELEPYSDMPDNCGKPAQSDEELWKRVKEAADHGMQLMCHAIGDAGIERILACYERLHAEKPINDRRFKIEHYQLITGDTPERMKAMGVIPSMQAMHGPDSADIAIKRLGPDRVRRAYATGLALRRIGIVIGGSDAPAATPRAMSGIHAQVTCTNDRLEPPGGFYPENAISREDALRSYTIWGAYAQFAENERGSLEVGKLADYVILDGDPMTVAADDILNINVLETVLEGETVYSR